MNAFFQQHLDTVTPLIICAVVLILAIIFIIIQSTKLRVLRERERFFDEDLQKALAQNEMLNLENAQLEQNNGNLDKQLAVVTSQKASLEQQLRDHASSDAEWREKLKTEFEQLSQRLFRQNSQDMVAQNQTTVTQLLQPFKQQLEGFQARINQVHSEAVKDSSAMKTQIEQFMNMGVKMSNEANSLTEALRGNKKALGNWGEMQLGLALESAGLIEGEHYHTQQSYNSVEGKRYIPDVVVDLPDGKQLVVDSKVSLNAYHSAVQAQADELTCENYLKQHAKDTKNHIDDLSRKDYSSLVGIKSPGFVFLFMPIEAAYLELLRQDPDIYQYALNKNIMLSSPSTLIPMLKTVSLLWMVENSSRRAMELGDRAAELYNQVALVGERLNKLGNSMGSAIKHYNATVTSFAGNRGLVGKVSGFNQLSSRTTKSIPEVQDITDAPDTSRVEPDEVGEPQE